MREIVVPPKPPHTTSQGEAMQERERRHSVNDGIALQERVQLISCR